MSTKGKTRWYPRYVHPVRDGFYECHVRLMGGANTLWMLEWDGVGFLVPMPMVVYRWRGQTKKAAHAKGGRMKREEIIKLAREAGWPHAWMDAERLERFAALVAASEREAKEELLSALQDLLMDTQHSEHDCGDKNCLVANAKTVALKYDTIRLRGQQ